MLFKRLKRLIIGVLTIIMVTGMCVSGALAAEENKETEKSKSVNYQEYAANLDKTVYNGNDLGAVYSKDSTTFKVWSPTASGIKVNIYEYGSDEEGDAGFIESKNLEFNKKTGVWAVKLDGDYAGKYYTYTIKQGKETFETYDIYAKGCGVNGKRSMVVDFSKTNPEGWENDSHILVSNATKASVWEVSVADFSSSESSGVTEKNRGKFLAFTENGTTVNNIDGGSPTCIDYLKKLGVKYVQIMPFYDFGSVDESKDIMSQYNWGYDPVNYNCPEGSYSSDPYNGYARILECKQMIQALHNAGIGVIMDVVYNHTYSTDSAFQYTVPNYYYRMNEDGTFSNGSGCSNDTASEHLMYRKYMIDSVTYWAKEYHIDGFRFDLMGLHDVTTLNEIRSSLDKLYEDESGKKIIMYGEAWDMATNCDAGTVLATQANLKQLDSRIGAFDDTIRDAIKGSTFGTGGGFVQDGSERSRLKIGIAGQSDSITGWAASPTQCVTYSSCHDNLCLYDKLVDTICGQGSEYRKRYENLVAMNKLAGAITITSQGIPFMLAGEEFARSKDGDENSYASSREENMLDWNNLNEFSDIAEYYRGLYKIRENFAALSDCTAMTANNLIFLDKLPKGVVGYKVNNTETGKWMTMCILFNGTENASDVELSGEWVVIADNETAGLRNLGETDESVTVQAHSALILVDKDSYYSAKLDVEEGAVTIDYYDNDSKELIKKQTVTGSLGSAFDVTKLAQANSFEIIEHNGNIQGEFTDSVVHSVVYVKSYADELSTVTFKFIDEETEEELTEAIRISNRIGEQYFTPEIPSVSGYRLDMDKLPTNGAGKLKKADIVVVYKYKHITDETELAQGIVNAIYMDDKGRIIEKNTIKGFVGEEYYINQNEYEEMTLISTPENFAGFFTEGEINVILNYTSTPDVLEQVMVYVYIGTGLILAMCLASVLYSDISRKKKYMAEMDIED
ncbi:MAG: type I pullulanase [Ruminococcus sp.]|nr:type I pullulanase [Ruminococcus sp.]